MSNSLTVEDIDGSTIITFVRPERRNPLTVEVVEELTSIVHALSTSDRNRKLIFTGTGEVFASGADLREIVEVGADSAEAFALRGQGLMNAISNLSVRTIAAINGYCFGGAMDLALACDVRIASDGAVFAHPGASLGIITGWGGTQRLPRLIGEARALEMFFTAKRVSVEEALQFGLVDKIVSDPLNEALNSPR
jgi:enoyl-CoA hydratase